MALPDHDSLREKAAECFLALEVGATDRLTRLRWRAWLAESAEHRQAVEDCRAAWIASAAAKVRRMDASIPATLAQHKPLPHTAGRAARRDPATALYGAR